MTNDAETTRLLKATLRKHFPGCSFSVKRGGEQITWTDDGPTQVEVEDAIVATGLVKIQHTYNGQRYVRAPTDHGSIYFDRYNAAERAADRQEQARRRQEYEDLRRKVAAECKKRRDAFKPIEDRPHAPVDNPAAVFETFERLRQRAEAEAWIQGGADRRPSWVPPLILGDELTAVCRELGYLGPNDKEIARLWATFACRGLQLHVGGTRGPEPGIIFEAQREESGA